MSKLFRRAFRLEEYSIVIAQYERGNFGVGTEEHLHWAIIVVINEEKQEGRMYQAINRPMNTPHGPVVGWELSTSQNASLDKSHKCLGAVRIGIVKQKELEKLSSVCVTSASCRIRSR